MKYEAKKGPWKIGELAAMADITVRALHHYDEIGILTPSCHTESGHRLYSKKDLERLQQIVAFKHLGFSLEQIRQTIYETGFSPIGVIKDLRETMRARRLEIEALEMRLENIEQALSREEAVSSELIINVIERIRMLEKYMTKEQLEKANEIEKSFSQERIRELTQVEWPALISEILREMDQFTPPSDPKVQKLAQRWKRLVDEKTKGDPEISKGLREALENEPEFAKETAAVLGHPGVDLPKVIKYMREALRESKNI